jgi:hypothetical protein
MTFEFDRVDLFNDKENQQIEFHDLLDDKDGKKEVVEHFNDKENQCLIKPPRRQVHEHLADQPIVQGMDGSPLPHVDEV